MTAAVDAAVVQRLRRVIVADAILTVVAGLFTITMWATVSRIGWLFVAGVCVLAAGGVMALGLLPLRHGRVEAAMVVLSVANWAIAVVSATIATFAWPLLMVSSLLPAVVAATFVPPDRLVRFLVPSLAVSLIVTATGTLQDWTGLTERAPDWLKTAILLVTAPGFGAVLVLAALQHHLSLTAVLDEERNARRREAATADELRASRQRVVAATDRERRRIERDLHDGAQSRLVGINLQLAAARRSLATDAESADAMLAELREEVHRAHRELRELAHGLYPTVLTQHGVGAAIEAAADRVDVPVQLDLGVIGRLPSEVEATIYFCVLEALQNTAKHASASSVAVRLRQSSDHVEFEVADDGVGVNGDVAPGHGLTNMADRLGAVGGELGLRRGGTGGTIVQGRVPTGAAAT